MKILVLAHEKYEDLELWYPVLRLREEGFEVSLAGEKAGAVYHGKYGYPAAADVSFLDVDYSQYGALIVPGGFASDKLRRFERVKEIIRYFDQNNLPIGQICHAGWALISAKILKGRTVTGFTAIRDDLENAGAIFVDKPVVTDKNLISAQTPADLPEFMKEFIKILK